MTSETSNVYLNGEFLPLGEARVSVLDRGFLFGDGVYEVIPVYQGRLFRLEEHLERLERSLQGIRLANPLSGAEWNGMLQQLVGQYPDQDLSVYLQVTRGTAEVRDHSFPDPVRPTVFAWAFPLKQPDPGRIEQGASAITLEDIRWQLCNIKAITLLANILLRQEAVEQDTVEAILLRDGYAYEGAATNLFIVDQGVIVTPPNGPLLLPGITRDLVVELAQSHNLPMELSNISEQRLCKADEVWLTSSTKEILPLTKLDGRQIGDGRPGPVWRRMRDLFQQYKVKIRAGEVG
jgi:D-alanine transaminase